MTKSLRAAVLVVLLALAAFPSWGSSWSRYPVVLIDSACTDSYDTPSAPTPPAMRLGNSLPIPTTATQTAGSPDGYCDADPYVAAGQQTVDVEFGPFFIDKSRYTGIAAFFNVSAHSGTYTLGARVADPYDGTMVLIGQSSAIDTDGLKVMTAGYPVADFAWNGVEYELTGPLPEGFYIRLNLGTSVDLDLSMVLLY